MQYTDVAWDFDGTLFDSYPRILDAFQAALADYGIIEPDEHVLRHITVSIGQAAEYYRKTYQVEGDLFGSYQTHSADLRFDLVKPFAGSREVLEHIVRSGRRNHLYTHRGESTYAYLDYYGFTRYFSEIITAQNAFPSKPDPSALQYVIHTYSVGQLRLLMVGDRVIDLLAAKNAGQDACFYNSNHLDIPDCADYVIGEISEVLKLL